LKFEFILKINQMKERLDKLLVEKELISSREKARAYIICGNITVDGEKLTKPSTLISRGASIKINLTNNGYVSRGGLKLDGALEDFNIDVSGTRCLDIGASTGGFTDCLLKRNAKSVIALDVGKNQIDYRLRKDNRVEVVEKFNARYIDRLGTDISFEVVTIDVSFISVKKILKPLLKIVDITSKIVALIKPQFELEKPYKGFRGVVTDQNIHKDILQDLNNFFVHTGYSVRKYTFSHLKGPKGNIEYFVYLKKNGPENERGHFNENIDSLVKRSREYFM
jgi:23S rRNA (cytidine1920-2'-O)/16S rRNA (cytidine1409-2'-O)-methyltransferase